MTARTSGMYIIRRVRQTSPGAIRRSSPQQATHFDRIHGCCHGSLHLPGRCVGGKSDAASCVVVSVVAPSLAWFSAGKSNLAGTCSAVTQTLRREGEREASTT